MPSSIINSDDGVISGTSGLKSTGGDDAVLLIQTKGVTAQTVDAGQRTMFPTTIGVGGATPSTSGSGITFPATQSASSNANTLDDYEEGSWTPTILGEASAGTTTYTLQNGRYNKIGNMVVVWCRVDYTAATGSGAMFIGGLPFTIFSDGGNLRYPGACMVQNLNWTAGTYLQAFAQSDGGSTVNILGATDDAGWTEQQVVNESATITITLVYRTSS